jgi:hypothetical protein
MVCTGVEFELIIAQYLIVSSCKTLRVTKYRDFPCFYDVLSDEIIYRLPSCWSLSLETILSASEPLSAIDAVNTPVFSFSCVLFLGALGGRDVGVYDLAAVQAESHWWALASVVEVRTGGDLWHIRIFLPLPFETYT